MVISNIWSRHVKVVKYIKIIGQGRQIKKWPPPIFFPIMSIVQLGFFTAYKFDTGCMDDIFRALEFNP